MPNSTFLPSTQNKKHEPNTTKKLIIYWTDLLDVNLTGTGKHAAPRKHCFWSLFLIIIYILEKCWSDLILCGFELWKHALWLIPGWAGASLCQVCMFCLCLHGCVSQAPATLQPCNWWQMMDESTGSICNAWLYLTAERCINSHVVQVQKRHD